VVVKPVPGGATAIGIPARIVESHENGGRFAAYAVARDANDPLAQAIQELVNHSVETDRRLERLGSELERLETKAAPRDAPQLDRTT